ncbi:hypothetical protein [Streptomyces spongiae]|uniref:hypothetical protein n=1 Tax=Streptomyces spongiae TaxID=565072 RepID=UPI0018832DFE|nr:hypothetical protein [Streptomyces spongiae]
MEYWAPYVIPAWFRAPATDFIAAGEQGFDSGVSIQHFLGGHTSDMAERRAIAPGQVTISQQAEVGGVLASAVCTGRFYDFLTRDDDGEWVIVRRQPIH